MNMSLYVSVVATVFSLSLLPIPLEATMSAENRLTEGIVKQVRHNFLIIKPQQLARVSDLAIEINDGTKLDNIRKLSDLKEGDIIKVEYQQQYDKKIATSIGRLASEDLYHIKAQWRI